MSNSELHRSLTLSADGAPVCGLHFVNQLAAFNFDPQIVLRRERKSPPLQLAQLCWASLNLMARNNSRDHCKLTRSWAGALTPPWKKMFLLFFVLLVFPISLSAARYLLTGTNVDWQSADRSSAGLLPQASQHRPALVRVFAARTVRWRGIFAVHSWIVVKEANTSRYTRYDYTAWGTPIRVNGFEADGRWFGGLPQVVAALDGEAAERAIPKIKAAIENYKFAAYGDYKVWPGPNSNTFVATVLNLVPELRAVLPPTAIGKDYPYDGALVALTATGLRFSLGGYLGLTMGLIEGLEINFFGAVVGVDLLRPALKLPGIGRIGMT